MISQLQARNLCRYFKIGQRTIDVLKGASLDINQGEAVFLIGVSGAGKTTLLYTLAGMERPQKGEVIFEGHQFYLKNSKDAIMRNRKMGFVFQSYFLLPELTALENVLIPAMIRRHDKLELAKKYLDRVGLGARLHHLPNEMSGGEQQRVAIARALINDPAIIFADEPTGNLDTASGHNIMETLIDLVHEEKKTLVVVTHDPKIATLGDRMLTIRDGLLVEPN
jgi:ABC-type lipoprotein export system ATPase subunit